MRSLIFGVVLCFGQICSSAADCSTNTPGVSTFGPECQYMCHCKNGTSCNTNTGECTQGCDTNWFGPACQYRDLAETQESRHNSNQSPARYSSFANDDDISTCSSTREAALSSARPWWRIWFPQNETIRDIYILTVDNRRTFFPRFEVTVEYVPDNQKTNYSYVPTYKHTCYTHSNTVPGSTSIYARCDKPIVGNQVRIKLATRYSQLVLCDVRVGAGRNFAFIKSVSASHASSNHPPLNAVDGRYFSSGWTGCSVVKDTNQKYFDINLGHPIDAYSVTISTNRDEFIQDYKIYTAPTGQTNLQLKYDDTGNTPPARYVQLNTTIQQLRMQSDNVNKLIVCELEIFGECPSSKCGYDCAEICFCKSFEDYEHKLSGVCTTGCQGRWTGINGKCNIECLSGTYGMGCAQSCSDNCVDVCDHVDGTCTTCKAGWKGDYCNTECDDGTYGIGCTGLCVPRCGATCDKVNGYCSQCPPGWKGNFCEIDCNIGTFGIGCAGSCGFCTFYTSCDTETGICPSGCMDGYTGASCNQECAVGTYGINCAGSCGFCTVHTSCDTETGICPSGCMDGYTGAICNQDIEQAFQSNTVAIIAGVVAGIVVICVTIIVAICVVMYRRRQPPPGITEPANRVEMSNDPTSASYEDLHQNDYTNDKEETNYETINPE